MRTMSKSSLIFTGASRGMRRHCLLATATMAGLWAAQATASPVEAVPVAASHVAAPVHSEGVVNLKALGAASARSAAAVASGQRPPESMDPKLETRAMPNNRFKTHPPLSAAEVRALVPRATPAKVVKATTPASFNGLDHFDQRMLADNGNQFSNEPPDQALAVGRGFILEAVNNALQVYRTNGTALLAAPVSMNRFFNQVTEFNRTTGQRGPTLSDPRAYFDWATGRFFVAEWATLNDALGNPLNISVQFLAVSQTSDPTGGWNVYSYETTNLQQPGCPCYPDFNQLGIDGSGVYISSDLFQLGGTGGFVGAEVFALPKAALEAGAPASVLRFPILPNDFKIHPTVTPPHGHYAFENHGTEYLVEGTADLSNNGIGTALNLWAITNTNSLAGSTPSLGLQMVSISTQSVTANLPNGIQKDGPRPLGGPQPGGLNDPVPLLNADDGGIGANPVYVNGKIWVVVNTAVVQPDTKITDGVAWFQMQTSGTSHSFTANLVNQGIISAPGDAALMYPAIAMNAAGTGGIGVTYVSPNTFPGTATIAMPEFSSPTITLSATGGQPEDGFTAYPQLLPGANGVARWGDYAAAGIDESGVFWFANEYIPDSAVHPRSVIANWGTYITRVGP